MHVWIQGQLPAGCKLALSHRFSLLSIGGATVVYTSEGPDPQLHFVLELMGFVLQSGWAVFPRWDPPAISAGVLLGMGLAPW